jgi:hypothetical protein
VWFTIDMFSLREKMLLGLRRFCNLIMPNSPSSALLRRGFRLLEGFDSASRTEKQKRIIKVKRLLTRAEATRREATLVLRAIDQLKKELAYMLLTAGKLKQGLTEIDQIARDYEKSIAVYNDEAAFQFAEAALACFRDGEGAKGMQYARSALARAGRAKAISKTLVLALEAAQSEQANSGRPLKRAKKSRPRPAGR